MSSTLSSERNLSSPTPEAGSSMTNSNGDASHELPKENAENKHHSQELKSKKSVEKKESLDNSGPSGKGSLKKEKVSPSRKSTKEEDKIEEKHSEKDRQITTSRHDENREKVRERRERTRSRERHRRRSRSRSQERGSRHSRRSHSVERYRKGHFSRSRSSSRGRTHSKHRTNRSRSRERWRDDDRERKKKERKSPSDRNSRKEEEEESKRKRKRTGWDKLESEHSLLGNSFLPGLVNLSSSVLSTGSESSISSSSSSISPKASFSVSNTISSSNEPDQQAIEAARKYAEEQQRLQQKILEQKKLALEQANAAAEMARACRIYVGSIPFEYTENEVRVAFSPFGTIKSISMSRDAISGKSKGFAFIEYTYPQAAEAALQSMNGMLFGGRPIKVGRPHHLGGTSAMATGVPGLMSALVPNMSATETTIQPVVPVIPKESAMLPSNSSNRIYVGSIFWDLTADDIKVVFQAFGPIKSCVLMPNPETGKHKGYGFIEFEKEESAELAIKHMHNAELGGRKIRVGRASQGLGGLTEAQYLGSIGTAASMSFPMSSLYPSGVMGGTAGSSSSSPTFPGDVRSGLTSLSPPSVPAMSNLSPAVLKAVEAAQLIANQLAQKKSEDSLTQEENLTISANQRYLVMQRLARESPLVTTSRCIVLKNMVDAEDVDDELEEEVTSECSKYGAVEKVVLYQDKQEGASIVKVFVLFSKETEAQKAVQALNGRWFGGRMIKAELFDLARFNKQDFSK